VLACDHDWRQVSWLAGRCPSPPSQAGDAQWLMAKGSPLTVAGAATESGLCSKEPTLTVFPFDPQREPSPERLDEIAKQVKSAEAASAINPSSIAIDRSSSTKLA